MKPTTILSCLLITLIPAIALAGTKLDTPILEEGMPSAEGAGLSADDFARMSSNPLGGDLLVILNQFDNYFMGGDLTNSTRNINTWALQPVIPIKMDDKIGPNWILVNRPTFPFILNAEIPDTEAIAGRAGRFRGLLPDNVPFPPPGLKRPPGGVPFTNKSGFGDIILFSLLGQSLPQERWGGGDLVWGLGPTWVFPTASEDALGSGQWQVGPSGVLSFIGKKFILGGLYQHWFSFAEGGNGSGANVNYSWLNLFYFLNFEGGWQVGGTPVITANWEADSNDRWTVPIGLGVQKTGKVFGIPMKLGIEAQWMAVSPDSYGQEWNIRFVIAPILPAPWGDLAGKK